MAHRCPGPRCDAKIPTSLLACREHWAQVPPVVRRRVYNAWNYGRGAGSEEHMMAIAEAIEYMEVVGGGRG